MAKNKVKLNVIDILVIVSVILLGLAVYLGRNNTPYLGTRTVVAEVEIMDVNIINRILSTVKAENGKTIFYNSSKYPVKQESFNIVRDESGSIEKMTIDLSAPGDVVRDRSIFNGQRIYVNQKVEIRGDYYVQAYISGYHYED